MVPNCEPDRVVLAVVPRWQFGHVVYVTDESERGDGIAFLRESLADPFVLGSITIGTLLLGACAIAYLYRQPAAADVAVVREALERYRDLLPWLLRLGFGIPLIGAGFAGYLFAPIVDPIVSTEVTRLVQVALGFAILFGIGTRVAAAVALVLYLALVPFAPLILYAIEWVPGLLAIIVIGSGRPSADQVLDTVARDDRTTYGRIDPVHRLGTTVRERVAPVRPFVPTLIRVGLGVTFIWLGLIEKLLAPNQAAAVVDHYALTTVVPIPASYWIVGVGLAEVGIGLALVVGLFSRFVAFAALGMFVLTLFALPDDPVLAHIGLFAMTSAILITGSGPLAIDRYLERRFGRQL